MSMVTNYYKYMIEYSFMFAAMDHLQYSTWLFQAGGFGIWWCSGASIANSCETCPPRLRLRHRGQPGCLRPRVVPDSALPAFTLKLRLGLEAQSRLPFFKWQKPRLTYATTQHFGKTLYYESKNCAKDRTFFVNTRDHTTFDNWHRKLQLTSRDHTTFW